MSSPVIKVENLSKQYRLGQVGTGTLSHDLNRWWHRIRGKEDPYLKIGETNDRSSRGSSEYVWALRDINFEVQQGEVLGIIGKNGAGKSTLLKILSKVTGPTTGVIKARGRIASLLEVGTGFHPELTGRENIFLNGTILGMTKTEVASKLDEIVAFAGVARYIDTPVKRYSSGMKVRLGFAVAAHLEPEILIVDEVLAVGDAEFQKRAIGKLQEVNKTGGRTVIFVSHNMESILALCSSAIFLRNGSIKSFGRASDCVGEYLSNAISENSNFWGRSVDYQKPSGKYIKNAALIVKEDQPDLFLNVSFTVVSLKSSKPSFVAIDINNSFGNTIMQAIPTLDRVIHSDEGENTISLKVHIHGLVPGTYSLSIWIGPHNNDTYDWVKDILSFRVIKPPTQGRTFPYQPNNGFLVPNSSIDIQG